MPVWTRFWPPLAVAALSIATLAPGADSIPYLAQGDHGRDLYAAEATLRGEFPYRDYLWQYGPIMPIYYGLAFAVLGVKAQSLLLAASLLTAFTAAVVFATLARIVGTGLALIGCWWFLLFQRDFPHTFTHAGGIAALAVLGYAAQRYLDGGSRRSLWLGCGAVLVLLLEKLNFGAIGLVFLIAVALVGERRFSGDGRRGRRLTALALGLGVSLAAALGVYATLLHGLPGYEILQNLPFLAGQRLATENTAAGLSWLYYYYGHLFELGPQHIVGYVLAMLGLWYWGKSLRERDARRSPQTRAIAITLVLYGLALHEVLLSGIWYRQYWGEAFAALAILLLGHQWIQRLGPSQGRAIVALLVLFCVFSTGVLWSEVAQEREARANLEHPRLQIRVGNDSEWRSVVEQTSAFIETQVAPGEPFLALPYDPLYYFLAGRSSPIRTLALLEFMNVSDEQEAAIIAELEAQNVNWIVLSSRAWSAEEAGIGVLGETHGHRLAGHIFTHFEQVAEFGDTSATADWAEHHATRIYRRH